MAFAPKQWLPKRSPTITLDGVVTDAFRGLCGRDPTEAERARHTLELENGAPLGTLLSELARSARPSSPPPVAEERQFVPPGHYYSPIPPRADVERQLAAMDPNPATLPGIALDRDAMVRLWNDLTPHLQSAPFAFEARPGYRYRYDNGAYSWGDGLVLHAMLRHLRPRRLIEVGSGWSSACVVDTNEHFLDSGCEVTCIEPYPGLLHETVGAPTSPFGIIESGIQAVPLDLFDALTAGDILFIDSTHVLRTGSDVTHELLEILPRIAPGVFVHFHDVFWPFEYPRSWAVDENRAWNEIYALRAFLCENPHWRIVMFNDFLAKNEAGLIGQTCPAFLNNPGGALWLERRVDV
jgi:hypothetical protein